MGFLDKLKEMAENLVDRGPRFDPAQFNDPLAERIEWGPAKGGGTNVGTHSLREVSHERVQFKVNLLALLFPGIFMVVGIAALIGLTVGAINSGQYILLLFAFVFGGVFTSVGFFIWRSWTTPRVFDKRLGYYWRGRKEPIPGMRDGNPKDMCKLEDVHAIQLLREYCRGNKSSYYSYELNLVLHDGTRINVVDHGKRRRIQEDGQQLGQFLNVPVWDVL